MKAVQTRSPIHLAYEYANLNNVIVSIWVSDTVNIDITTTPDYQLNSQAINDFATVEISELIRSKNDYIFNPDFYEKRDTAKYVLIRGELLDSSDSELEVKYDFLRVRDGYIQRVNDVTVKNLPQIFNRLIPANIGDWFQSTPTPTTTTGIQDPFNGSNAIKKTTSNFNDYTISTSLVKPLKTGTFSMYYKVDVNANLEFTTFKNNISQGFADINLDTKVVSFSNTGGSVDIIELNNNWNLLSFSFNNNTEIDELELLFTTFGSEEIMNIDFLSFSLREGDNLQSEASELILQDNYEVFTDQNISYMADKKYTNGNYQNPDIQLDDLSEQSKELFVLTNSEDLIYDDLGNNETIQTISRQTIDECKYTPTKISFINRFGVIQDLVFFKKRTDNIDTDKESYKTNVLQQGNYYPHIGQNQTIRKESKRSVTLNTGFYPEEFNTVFEQLQNSLHYWIDDEPAVLEGSSFNVKTRVNDKLINYTFDFSYSNEEVNTI
jgi:hypothetical protein